MVEIYFEKVSNRNERHAIWRDLVLKIAKQKLGFTPEILTHPNGKPYIDGLHFNISHSGEYVVCAFADSSVGIDMEKIGKAREKIVEHLFHKEERLHLERAPNRDLEFYKIWTMKESYLKCLGFGITKDLSSFSVFDIPNMHTEIRDGYVISVCTT